MTDPNPVNRYRAVREQIAAETAKLHPVDANGQPLDGTEVTQLVGVELSEIHVTLPKPKFGASLTNPIDTQE